MASPFPGFLYPNLQQADIPGMMSAAIDGTLNVIYKSFTLDERGN
jgi:hypothetical protein